MKINQSIYSVHYYWTLLLVLSLFQTAVSQDISLDSTIVKLNEDLYADSIRMSTLQTSKNALKQAYSQGSEDNIADLHAFISAWYDYYNYNEEGLAQDSIIYHETKALEIYENQGLRSKVAKSYLNLALSYINQEQYKSAEDHILLALNYYDDNDDQKGIGVSNKYLCSLYLIMEEYEKSITYGHRSNEILVNFEDEHTTRCINHFNMVRAYTALDQNEEAVNVANSGLQILKNNGLMDEFGILARILAFRGAAFQNMKDYKAAEQDYTTAYTIIKDWVGEERAVSWREDIGNILVAQGKYYEALPHLEASIKAHEEVHNYANLWLPFEKLKNCYEKIGDYKNAYLYSQKIGAARDSMYTRKIATLNAEGMLKYETEKKEETIRAKDLQISNQIKIQYLGASLFMVLLTLLASLLYNYRKNKKISAQLKVLNNDLQQSNTEKEILLKEIHHRVKNNLQVISSLLNFQSRSIDDKIAKNAIMDSQSRVRSMSLIHQKLYRGTNLAAVEMKSYLSALSESLIDAYSDEEAINVSLNMESIELDVDYAIPIGLIVNELITNSLKHAFPAGNKGSIEVRLYQEKEDLVLDISDDGVGSTTTFSDQSGGFGSELVDMLTMQLKGKLTQDSNSGFQTILRLPLASAA